VVRAIGGEYQQLSQRVDLFVYIEQGRAQSPSQGSAAGFAGRHDLQATDAQFARQQSQLRGFPATVNSFKGDESAGHLLLSCALESFQVPDASAFCSG